MCDDTYLSISGQKPSRLVWVGGLYHSLSEYQCHPIGAGAYRARKLDYQTGRRHVMALGNSYKETHCAQEILEILDLMNVAPKHPQALRLPPASTSPLPPPVVDHHSLKSVSTLPSPASLAAAAPSPFGMPAPSSTATTSWEANWT